MLRVLVMDPISGRRADIVDALCEVPGVEVCRTDADGTTLLRTLERTRCDAIVASCELTAVPLAAVLELARARGVATIVLAPALPALYAGIAAYWRDLGASAVVHALAELVACTAALAPVPASLPSPAERAPTRDEPALGMRAFTRRAQAVIAAGTHDRDAAPALATRELVSLPVLLAAAIPRWAELIPPDVQIEIITSGDVPRARCLPRDIERITLHLVLDACAALPLGGTIWLCVERAGTRHVRLEVIDSSGRRRNPTPELAALRLLARRHAGELRAIELGGGPVSVALTLPAVVNVAS